MSWNLSISDSNARYAARRPRPAGPAPGRKPLAPSQGSELIAYRDSLNPPIGRDIADLQNTLLKPDNDKTEQLYLATPQRPAPTSARASRTGAPG